DHDRRQGQGRAGPHLRLGVATGPEAGAEGSGLAHGHLPRSLPDRLRAPPRPAVNRARASPSLAFLAFTMLVIVAAVAVRDARLGNHVRWALTAATAAGGTSIVYSVETRSYALLALTSVGLTATTLRAAVQTLDGERVPVRTSLSWFGWSLAGATTHLFGAV